LKPGFRLFTCARLDINKTKIEIDSFLALFIYVIVSYNRFLYAYVVNVNLFDKIIVLHVCMPGRRTVSITTD